MNETPFFFSNGHCQLFGILHEPDVLNGQGFVFCHPFAEEKLWTHRVFVTFARRLTKLGCAVLRFDYGGHGDSTGNFEDSTVESRLTDIQTAMKEIRNRCPKVKYLSLVGLRFGGTLAAMVAQRTDDVDRLILWEPIVNGAKYMKEMLRINLTTQTAVYKEIRMNTEALVASMKNGGSVSIDGYELRYPLYEQMIAINLESCGIIHNGNVLLVQINKIDGMIINRIEKLKTAFPNADLVGVKEEPFWKEIQTYYAEAANLFKKTLEWINDK